MTASRWGWTAILAVAVLVRLLTLDAYPLADTTEARYAEVARLMLASGDWVTPQIEAGVPFWGKPPLSFWLTALSFKVFGLSEYAARLPSFLLLASVVALLVRFGGVTSGRTAGTAAGVILLTSALGFVSAGAVMTDPALLLSTTLVMLGFWRAVIGRQRRWGLLLFAGLALGLLAKGPVAWVLSLMPVGMWIAWRGNVADVTRALPWRRGSLIVAVIGVPWYLLAERHSPGFLEYFVVGEHWLRFVDSGWQGDLYGSAHAEARGTIWVYWLASAFPWSVIAIGLSAWKLRGLQALRRIDDRAAYLLLWACMPMLFFTFAGNILPTYVLPGLPAFALLLAEAIDRRGRSLLYAGWLIPVAFAVLGPLKLFDQVADRSQRELVSMAEVDCEQTIYLAERPYSAEFYSAGRAILAPDHAAVRALLGNDGTSCVAVRNSAVAGLPPKLRERLQPVATFRKFALLREQGVPTL